MGLPAEIDLDGYIDRKGVRFLGKAVRQPNGLYICLADVDGCLCRVEVRITPEGEKPRWGVWIRLEHWATVDGGPDWHGTEEEARAKVVEYMKNDGEPLPPGVFYEARPYNGDDPA